MENLKKYECIICGRKYTAKIRNYRPTCSIKCGLTRLTATVEQIRLKRGPYYRKHLKGLTPTEKQAKNWAERYRKGMLTFKTSKT